MKDVEILRQSIRAVTQILTVSDVRVTQQGMDAYTSFDNKSGKITQINLPYLPDDAPESLIQAVQGYLDHEVGHALFTDFEVVRSVTDDCTKQLHNIVEDAFVERKMIGKFRGSAYNIGNVSEFFREKHLNKVIATGNEDDIKKCLIVAAIRAFSGQESYMTYMSDKWHYLEDFKKKVEPLSAMLSSTKTTKDCLNAAIAIKEAIEDKKPPQSHADEGESDQTDKPNKSESDDNQSAGKPVQEDEEEGDDEEGGETDDNQQRDEDDDDSEGESDSDEADESDSDDDEGDDSEGDSNSGDEDEGDEEGESSGDAKGSDDVSDSNESEEDSGSEMGTNSSESESDGSDDDANQDEVADDEDFTPPPQSMSELISDGLNGEFGQSLANEVANKAQLSDYLIYTDEYDELGLYEDIKFGALASEEQVKVFEDAVSHMMSPIQKDIERAICARSASTHTGGFRSGKLHSSALSRLATNDDRIFRRKQINTTKDVAVSLVMDCSGSMGGSKIKLAAYSAYTLSTVLDRLGINHEVIGFTSGSMESNVFRKMEEESQRHNIRYARYETTIMPIFKTYNERMSMKVKKRLANVNEGCLGANVDGESIAIAAKRLMAQKEKGKVMIVLSDGMPAVWGNDIAPHLKQTVKQIEASGVNIVGIGIHSKAVEQFYSKSIYVDDISQLPSVVGRQLKAMLLGSSK